MENYIEDTGGHNMALEDSCATQEHKWQYVNIKVEFLNMAQHIQS